MAGPGYAVVDVETTGLNAGGGDRIVEIAIVHVSLDGTVTGRWETLVNPGRDLGPQRIHHIRAVDVLDAPTFAEIAPKLVELLSGRVFVAHNASFDSRFLLAELERIGYHLWSGIETLCTMRLAREFIPGAGRALADCCDAFGIELENAHRASVDALATAKLLEAYILQTPMWQGWSQPGSGGNAEWPVLTGPEVEWRARDARANPPAHFLERITMKLPEYSGPAECLDYLALLDRCLLDWEISSHEADSLVNLAETAGISQATCMELHQEYFDHLSLIAWADGELTIAEINQLVSVGGALRLPAKSVANAMNQARVDDSQRLQREQNTAPNPSRFALKPGDKIVLTGEMVRQRSDWENDLIVLGYLPWPSVTKKVAIVVAADQDSLSGKARKARDYGIPVVGEEGLGRLIGLVV
jgi:DNA polymerase-3 subunit epsilon